MKEFLRAVWRWARWPVYILAVLAIASAASSGVEVDNKKLSTGAENRSL